MKLEAFEDKLWNVDTLDKLNGCSEYLAEINVDWDSFCTVSSEIEHTKSGLDTDDIRFA